MLPTASAHLPGTGGEFRANADDLACEEILVRQAGGAGKHWWVKAVRTDISTSQARAAVARSVGLQPEQVGMSGNRDRRAKCTQWFSVPDELVENANSLKNAGFRGGLRVVELAQARGPIGPDSVVDLRWTLRLRDAGRGDGFHRAKAILGHVRTTGLPNYVHPSRFAGGDLVKWGRAIVTGGRLPPAVAKTGVQPGECLAALQWSLFNRWLAARVGDGLLGACLAGERVRTGVGDEVVVDDPVAWQKRFDSWEAVPLGPLYGGGMPPAAGAAAEREQAALADSGFADADLARLKGGRRDARVQPRKVDLDRDGNDLRITCDLPAHAYIAVLADEVIKPVE